MTFRWRSRNKFFVEEGTSARPSGRQRIQFRNFLNKKTILKFMKCLPADFTSALWKQLVVRLRPSEEFKVARTTSQYIHVLERKDGNEKGQCRWERWLTTPMLSDDLTLIVAIPRMLIHSYRRSESHLSSFTASCHILDACTNKGAANWPARSWLEHLCALDRIQVHVQYYVNEWRPLYLSSSGIRQSRFLFWGGLQPRSTKTGEIDLRT